MASVRSGGPLEELGASVRAAYVCLEGARRQLEYVRGSWTGETAGVWHHLELRGFGRQALRRAERLVNGVDGPATLSPTIDERPGGVSEVVRDVQRLLSEIEEAAERTFRAQGLGSWELGEQLTRGIQAAGHDRVHQDVVALLERKPLHPLLMGVDEERGLTDAWFVRLGMRLAGEELRPFPRASLQRDLDVVLAPMRAALAEGDAEIALALRRKRAWPSPGKEFRKRAEAWGKVYGFAEDLTALSGDRPDGSLSQADHPWTGKVGRGEFQL